MTDTNQRHLGNTLWQRGQGTGSGNDFRICFSRMFAARG